MRYYSDVRILVTEKGYKKLQEFVNKQLNENKDQSIYNLLENCDIKEKKEHLYYLGWDYRKWYPNYLDVQLIKDGLKMLEEQNLSYEVVRMGEDLEDIEILSSYSDDDTLMEYITINREFDDDEFVSHIPQFRDDKLTYQNDNGFIYNVLELDNVNHYALLERYKRGKFEYNVCKGFYLNLSSWGQSAYFNDLESAQDYYAKLKSKDINPFLYKDELGIEYEILELDNIHHFALLKKDESSYLVVENFDINSALNSNHYPFNDLMDAQECYIALKCDELGIKLEDDIALG